MVIGTEEVRHRQGPPGIPQHKVAGHAPAPGKRARRRHWPTAQLPWLPPLRADPGAGAARNRSRSWAAFAPGPAPALPPARAGDRRRAILLPAPGWGTYPAWPLAPTIFPRHGFVCVAGVPSRRWRGRPLATTMCEIGRVQDPNGTSAKL